VNRLLFEQIERADPAASAVFPRRRRWPKIKRTGDQTLIDEHLHLYSEICRKHPLLWLLL
jgi:hypothetical protein